MRVRHIGHFDVTERVGLETELAQATRKIDGGRDTFVGPGACVSTGGCQLSECASCFCWFTGFSQG